MRDHFNRWLLIVFGGVCLTTLLIGLQSHFTGSPDSPTPRYSDGSQRAFETAFPGLADLSPAQLDRYIDAQRSMRNGMLP